MYQIGIESRRQVKPFNCVVIVAETAEWIEPVPIMVLRDYVWLGEKKNVDFPRNKGTLLSALQISVKVVNIQ